METMRKKKDSKKPTKSCRSDPLKMKTSTEVVSSFRTISMISKYHRDTCVGVWASGFRVRDSEFRVSGFGFRV